MSPGHARHKKIKTRVQKWGNSLALRIPKSFADQAGFSEDCPVGLSLVKGKVIVETIKKKPVTLADLLEGMTDDQLHSEWQTGRALGGEIW
jgi:antitoxin MazE